MAAKHAAGHEGAVGGGELWPKHKMACARHSHSGRAALVMTGALKAGLECSRGNCVPEHVSA